MMLYYSVLDVCVSCLCDVIIYLNSSGSAIDGLCCRIGPALVSRRRVIGL